jgi:hypothetical protein
MSRIRFWQWPNLLALDAAVIAVLWQALFAHCLERDISLAARVVLGLSVWLTYLSDRLFDVAPRPRAQLLSERHRFAKRQARRLWKVWGCVLIFDLFIALRFLSAQQLEQGLYLLVLCLTYTGLNQWLSRKFFPKELCVSLIYAAGVLVFLGPPFPWMSASLFAGLCLINCLIIGIKEKPIDRGMRVHSMSPLMAPGWIALLFLLCAALLFKAPPGLAYAAAISLLLLVLHFSRRNVPIEGFRVLADGILLLGPIPALLTTV